jgi:SHS2 domain-containing protein
MTEHFEEIEHTADYAIQIHAEDLPSMFIAAAKGMNHLTGGQMDHAGIQRQIELSANDLESLLVIWLEELAFLMEVEGEIYEGFQIVSISPTQLQARIAGGPVTHVEKLIKAVTFHDLSIRKTENGWRTSIVFDV